MFARLDAARSLTGNQIKIVAAAIIGDMLEFFDYFLIAFVLAFIIKPWQLTGGQSAIILLSSGIGAILGAFIWGRIADLYGRRQVFILTVLNFSIASGLLYFTPENGWIYLSVMRFFVGFGVGGLYCVDLPLVQEFVPARMRGFIGGLVTVFIPLGVMIASSFAAFFTNAIGWRGLFLIGLLPAAFTLVIRGWVPELPHWLMTQGRREDARRSIAWALRVPPETLPLPNELPVQDNAAWTDLFKYPRSLAVSWMASIGAQTAGYGIILWAPTLFVLQLGVTPAYAAYLFLWVSLAGIAGRISFSLLSELIGSRPAGLILGFGGMVCIARGRPRTQRDDRFGFVVLADDRLRRFLLRRRFRGDRPLYGRGVADPPAHHRHGLGLRLRRPWQNHRSAGPRADDRRVRRDQATGDGGRDRAGVPVFRRMDGVVRLRFPVLRLRDRTSVADRDRHHARRSSVGRRTFVSG